MNPPCFCGSTSVLKIVQKEGPNKGREFFRCPDDPGCKFFKWADQPSPPPRRAPGKRPRKEEEGGLIPETEKLTRQARKMDAMSDDLLDILASSCALTQKTLEKANIHEGKLGALVEILQKCVPCLEKTIRAVRDEDGEELGKEEEGRGDPKPPKKRSRPDEDRGP